MFGFLKQRKRFEPITDSSTVHGWDPSMDVQTDQTITSTHIGKEDWGVKLEHSWLAEPSFADHDLMDKSELSFSTPCSPLHRKDSSSFVRAAPSLSRQASEDELFSFDDSMIDEQEPLTSHMIQYWEGKTTSEFPDMTIVPRPRSLSLADHRQNRAGEVKRLVRLITENLSSNEQLPPREQQMPGGASLNDWELYRQWELSSIGEEHPRPDDDYFSSFFQPRSSASMAPSAHRRNLSAPLPSTSSPLSPHAMATLSSSSSSSAEVQVNPFTQAMADVASGTTRLRPPPPPPSDDSEEPENPPMEPAEFERQRLKQLWERKTLEELEEQKRQIELRIKLEQRRQNRERQRAAQLSTQLSSVQEERMSTQQPLGRSSDQQMQGLHMSAGVVSQQARCSEAPLRARAVSMDFVPSMCTRQNVTLATSRTADQSLRQAAYGAAGSYQHVDATAFQTIPTGLNGGFGGEEPLQIHRRRRHSLPSPVSIPDTQDFSRQLQAPSPPNLSPTLPNPAPPVSELIKFWDETIDVMATQPVDESKAKLEKLGSSLLCGPAQLAQSARTATTCLTKRMFRTGSFRGDRAINPKQYVRIMKRRRQKQLYNESHVFVKNATRQANRVRQRGANGRYLNVGPTTHGNKLAHNFCNMENSSQCTSNTCPSSPANIQSPSGGLTLAFANLLASEHREKLSERNQAELNSLGPADKQLFEQQSPVMALHLQNANFR
eukprot:gb/GEZN01002938.1/.p1 GENE.gb/GEZN01002938.1/~~gb/GEZN01002938.1/.p1  ORF type:complete len:719 (+),score=110.85 gb/GEZN01002938.1/:40-2196(+)